jgi:hypothetical protein
MRREEIRLEKKEIEERKNPTGGKEIRDGAPVVGGWGSHLVTVCVIIRDKRIPF